MANQAQAERYARHIRIPEIGKAGQEKLCHAKVLVIGAGGLGAPLLLYLAAAGVGNIGIVDFDIIEESNLQRQILFATTDMGKLKVDVAKKNLLALNPGIEIKTYPFRLTAENAIALFNQYDIIADGTDNFATRYLVNDAAVLTQKVNVFGSIYRFEGQVSVFNFQFEDGSTGPNYRDLFPVPPEAGTVPSCAEAGVLGVLPGIVGSCQANEVIKIICGLEQPLAGKLWTFNALTMETHILNIHKDPDNPLTGLNPTQNSLIDYEDFCGIKNKTMENIKQIQAEELKKWMEEEKDFLLIDVREPFEYDEVNINGRNIPLSSFVNHLNEIEDSKPIVLHCRMGQRSLVAANILQQNGFREIYNLEGGIIAFLS